MHFHNPGDLRFISIDSWPTFQCTRYVFSCSMCNPSYSPFAFHSSYGLMQPVCICHFVHSLWGQNVWGHSMTWVLRQSFYSLVRFQFMDPRREFLYQTISLPVLTCSLIASSAFNTDVRSYTSARVDLFKITLVVMTWSRTCVPSFHLLIFSLTHAQTFLCFSSTVICWFIARVFHEHFGFTSLTRADVFLLYKPRTKTRVGQVLLFLVHDLVTHRFALGQTVIYFMAWSGQSDFMKDSRRLTSIIVGICVPLSTFTLCWGIVHLRW